VCTAFSLSGTPSSVVTDPPHCLPKNTQLTSCCVYNHLVLLALVVIWSQLAIMEFTTTTRGALALVLNGFKYVLNRKNASGKIYWRCAVNRQCGTTSNLQSSCAVNQSQS